MVVEHVLETEIEELLNSKVPFQEVLEHVRPGMPLPPELDSSPLRASIEDGLQATDPVPSHRDALERLQCPGQPRKTHRPVHHAARIFLGVTRLKPARAMPLRGPDVPTLQLRRPHHLQHRRAVLSFYGDPTWPTRRHPCHQ